MKLSWLAPEVINAAREALKAHHEDWESFFRPDFQVPPVPKIFEPSRWAEVAEHVARAERVEAHARQLGAEAAIAAFGDSPHAVEVAACIAAADKDDVPCAHLVERLLEREIDQLIVYGTFLGMLIDSGTDRTLVAQQYEKFCHRCENEPPHQPHWSERVELMRDGLGSLLVRAGDYEKANRIFAERHEEDETSLTTALTASRSFLAAGQVARSIHWLRLGELRAQALGRGEMAHTLARKQETLRKRMS